MKNTSMRVLLLACFGLVLCINCTNADNQTFALIDETMDIISPAGESSFAEGENIVFQWEQADANVQQPDVYLDNQIINIVAGDMLPELPVGEHTLKLGLKEKMMDEVTFFVHKAKPVAISDEVDETMGIISPAGESSFADGENIVFQWEQADANVQQPDVYLDNQIINIVAGDMLPELPVGEHTLKLGLKEKMMDEVTFFVHKAKPVAISFKTLAVSAEYTDSNVLNVLCPRALGTFVAKTRDEWHSIWRREDQIAFWFERAQASNPGPPLYEDFDFDKKTLIGFAGVEGASYQCSFEYIRSVDLIDGVIVVA